MVRRLILDTNILVDLERQQLDQSALASDEFLLPGIVVAEFRLGIELRGRTARARRAEAALQLMLDQCTFLDYTLGTAESHATLLAETTRNGQSRGDHDLIIAAHAAQTGHTILTRDATARFGGLTGVHAIDPAEL